MKKLFYQPNKARTEKNTLQVQGIDLPTTIYYEKRNGYRCSFTKGGLNIRIPLNVNRTQQKKLVQHCLMWAKETVQNKPQLLAQYKIRKYQTGDLVRLFDKTYQIEVNHHKKTTIHTKIKETKLMITLPETVSETIIKPKIISKAFAHHYREFLQQKVDYWNQFFPIKHNTLRLKYNSSNWGSCSTKKNINLSTRLLLCTESVIDYVIVHELAHLIQQNHSRAFWLEVERVYPNYKQEVRWLKTKGAHLDF